MEGEPDGLPQVPEGHPGCWDGAAGPRVRWEPPDAGKAAGREPQKPGAAEPLRKQAAEGQVQPGHPVHPETEDAV